MTHSSFVSVVMPCYRNLRYLPQAVESVLQQQYRDLELIVVNDGSPEPFAEAIAPYERDPRVRVSQ